MQDKNLETLELLKDKYNKKKNLGGLRELKKFQTDGGNAKRNFSV